MKYFTTLFAVLFFLIGECAAQKASKDNFNIVLITIDALRPDHLSCYGYERNTSPNIDRIAEQGIIFENAISPSTWTLPSMVSLFTSTYPINHGVTRGRIENGEAYNYQVFSDNLITLAEILQKSGYTTFGVASNSYLDENFGFARGFDYFKSIPFLPALSVNEIVYSWEDKINKADKYFLWLHYIDPHFPYSPQNPWIDEYIDTKDKISNLLDMSTIDLMNYYKQLTEDNQEVAKYAMIHFRKNLLACYDSEINYVDSYVGKLIQKFKFDNNALIIITADHGEGFFEHGLLGHTFALYQEIIQIPLIVKLPYSTKREIVNKQVNLVDIYPSILQTFNIDPPEHIVGESFLRKKDPFLWLKKIFINEDEFNYNISEAGNFNAKAIITPEWKYIHSYINNVEQLYNLKNDPLEINNLAEEETKRCNDLKEQLFKWVSKAIKYPVKEQHYKFTQEEKEKLEALGYIEMQGHVDYDGDGILDDKDNCPFVANPAQEDTYPPQGNSIGDACECEADFDCDGDVDQYDLETFLANYGQVKTYKPSIVFDLSEGDFDCDSDVDDKDLIKLLEDSGGIHQTIPVLHVKKMSGVVINNFFYSYTTGGKHDH